MWNQLCSCRAGVLEGASHGIELSRVETCGSDDEQRHERASTVVDAARNQSDACGGRESEDRAASGPRHSRASSQRHPQHRRAADTPNGDIEVVASEGPPGGKADAKFRLGEGITGRVVQSGKPIVVPRVSREPMFLRRTSDRPELAREEISYVCVPILLNRKAVGALGADFRFKAERDFDRTVKFLGRRRVAHGAVDPHSARHRRRARSAARGKHAPQERAARALRLLEHPRHERADAARLRAGVAGRAHRHDRAHPRRVGHRQGADRAGHPLQLAALEAAVHQGELRGAAGEPHRVGAVRLRERARSPGAHATEEGALRARRRGHAVSRRNRRAQPGDADQAAARAFRRASSSGWAARRRFAPTCG